MRQYFKTSQLSEEEKSDILSKHRTTYNGYKRLHPEISNTPLYVQDFIGDKDGMVINNKGEVKKYTNFGINEDFSKVDLGKSFDKFKKSNFDVSDDDDWFKNKLVDLPRNEPEDIEDEEPTMVQSKFDFGDEFEEINENSQICEQCGREMNEGECMECGMSESKGETCEQCGREMNEGECMECGKMYEESGHLDDIYDVEDLNSDSGFDYLEGKSNKKNTFKKRNLELDEYNFESQGPGLGNAYPVNEYEHMESAWADDDLNEDISGVQGIYGDMEPGYNFISKGAGAAGPYQRSNYNEELENNEMGEGFSDYFDDDYKAINDYLKKHGDDEDEYTPTEDLGYATHTGDFGGDDSEYDDEDRETAISRFRRKGAEDIEFEELDDDIKESFENQKHKINEMFHRMSKYN